MNMKEKTKVWLRAAGIRALRTVAQTAIATIGPAMVLGDVDWATLASSTVMAGILLLLTSLKFGLPEVPEMGNKE